MYFWFKVLFVHFLVNQEKVDELEKNGNLNKLVDKMLAIMTALQWRTRFDFPHLTLGVTFFKMIARWLQMFTQTFSNLLEGAEWRPQVVSAFLHESIKYILCFPTACFILVNNWILLLNSFSNNFICSHLSV